MPDLRIIAGEWRGRRFKVPPVAVRPTSDRVREAWMSIVHAALDGARVVDLCAGSGALGLEALSRGAAHCDFVEKSPEVQRVLEANIVTLGAGERAAVQRTDAVSFLEAASDSRGISANQLAANENSPGTGVPGDASPRWDVAFADPPYREGIAQALAERWLKAPFATIFGVEHEVALELAVPAQDSGCTADRRNYGDTAITIFRSPS